MNMKYIAKNPSPAPQTITIPQGLPLDGGRLRSTEAVTLQLPPMSQREITFDENGKPIIDGCIQDLTITDEHEEGTPLTITAVAESEPVSFTMDVNSALNCFTAKHRPCIPTLPKTTTAFWEACNCSLNSPT